MDDRSNVYDSSAGKPKGEKFSLLGRPPVPKSKASASAGGAPAAAKGAKSAGAQRLTRALQQTGGSAVGRNTPAPPAPSKAGPGRTFLPTEPLKIRASAAGVTKRSSSKDLFGEMESSGEANSSDEELLPKRVDARKDEANLLARREKITQPRKVHQASSSAAAAPPAKDVEPPAKRVKLDPPSSSLPASSNPNIKSLLFEGNAFHNKNSEQPTPASKPKRTPKAPPPAKHETPREIDLPAIEQEIKNDPAKIYKTLLAMRSGYHERIQAQIMLSGEPDGTPINTGLYVLEAKMVRTREGKSPRAAKNQSEELELHCADLVGCVELELHCADLVGCVV